MNRARGFTLVEFMVVVVLMGLATIGLTRMMAGASMSRFDSVTADQMVQARTSLNVWATNNQATLGTCATTTVPCAVTVAQLQTAGLPATFNTINPYGQSYKFEVLKDTNGNFLPMVCTSGGTTIPDTDVRQLAAKITQMGGEGGYISNAQPTIAQGANGSWGAGLTVANWGCNTGGGHIVDALFVRNAALLDDYLHRHAVAGQPQLQQMDAAIDMNSNALNNVASANLQAGQTLSFGGATYIYGDTANIALRPATGGAVYLQTAGGGGTSSIAQVGNITGTGTFTAPVLTATSQVNSSGAVVAVGNIYSTSASVVAAGNVYVGSNTSGGNNGTNASLILQGNGTVDFATWGGGWMMQDGTWIRAVNNKSIFTGGTIWGGTVSTSNNLTFTGATVFQGNGCSGSQLAASVDGTGQILQCKSGVWRTLGGYTSFTTVTGPTASGNGSTSFATCPAGWTIISGGYDTVGTSYTFAFGPLQARVDQASNSFVVTDGDPQFHSQYVAFGYCAQ